MSCTVVIATYRGANYLSHIIRSLGAQSFKEFETIFVVKPSGDGTVSLVEDLSNDLNLEKRIILQKEGNVTKALQLGVEKARGDVILFTDDDAILPGNWLKKHLDLYQEPRIGAVSGNILNYDLHQRRVLPLETSAPLVRIYRKLFRPIIDRPHKLFVDYRQGVYVTWDYRIVAGRGIPSSPCLSLPCRGVNLSFRTMALKNIDFPEHPSLRRYLLWEPYLGVQVVVKGWKALYDPSIVVYHIIRQSLSRTSERKEVRFERNVMRKMLGKYLTNNAV